MEHGCHDHRAVRRAAKQEQRERALGNDPLPEREAFVRNLQVRRDDIQVLENALVLLAGLLEHTLCPNGTQHSCGMLLENARTQIRQNNASKIHTCIRMRNKLAS
jgi:hypothetical protein